MLGRKLTAVGLGEQPALRDTDQRVMRFVIVGRGEERFVGRDQRQRLRIGDVDEMRFGGALFRQPVTLQLDIEPVAEQTAQRGRPRQREIELSGGDRLIERARPVRRSVR